MRYRVSPRVFGLASVVIIIFRICNRCDDFDVGYQRITLNKSSGTSVSWSFKTVTFKDIAGNDEQYVDILDVVPLKANGDAWPSTGVGNNVLTTDQLVLYKISKTGAYTERCQYISKGAITGWQTYPKTGSAVKINRGDYTLGKGEGVVILYKKTVDCLLQMSGEVELSDLNTTLPASTGTSVNWMFGGNTTPVKIDILDVTPTKNDGSVWPSTGVGNNVMTTDQLVLYKISTAGAYIDRIQYVSKGAITGWQTYPKSGSAHALVADEWTLDPGEGFVVLYKKTVPCKLLFPNPTASK